MKPVIERLWLPPAAVVPQERGPDFLAPVDGTDWSEGIGFYRGFFSAFRIRAGKDVWFHFPFPTPVERDGSALAVSALSLLWETLDGAKVTWLILQHGGMERIELSERLSQPASRTVAYEPPAKWREYHPAASRQLTEIELPTPLVLQFGIQLCVAVSAGAEDGTVRFFGAGATFCQA